MSNPVKLERHDGYSRFRLAGSIPLAEAVQRLKAASSADTTSVAEHLTAAGQLMLQSHRSYTDNADLGSPETDLLVDLVMQRGPAQGLYGARVTGGGGGGTVAVLARNTSAGLESLQGVCAEYRARTGIAAALVAGSSSGVAEVEPHRVPAAEL